MPYYKIADGRYFVKISVHGKQVLRRIYLGLPMYSEDVAMLCERDLKIEYSDIQTDYELNDLVNLYEEYFYKTHKETSAKRCIYDFRKNVLPYFKGRRVSSLKVGYLDFINDGLNHLPKQSCKCEIYLCKNFLDFFHYCAKL